MVGQHAWSGVVAGTKRDSFLVSGNYLAFHCKPPVPLFRLYRLLGEERLHVLDKGADDGGRQLTA
jgi:hypothetical protein